MLAAVFASTLAACGSTAPTLKTAAVAQAIRRSILTQRNILAVVQCPPTVPREVGEKFTCTARLDVGSYPVSVTVINASGRISYGNPAPLVTLNIQDVQRAITASILAQRRVKTTVTCPAHVLQHAGLAFTCSANLEIGGYPITVTETNSSGHVRFGNPAPLVILNVPKVQRAIEGSILSQRHLKSTVACPAQVLQQAGVSFTCTATVNGTRYPFAVTETNSSGHVRYEGLRVKGR